MTTNRTFIPREHLRIALSKEEISVVNGWHEASVTKVLNSGEKLVAWVPLHSLGDDQSWVPAQILDVEDDDIFLVLPTGNTDITTWCIPQDELHKMLLVDSDGPAVVD